MRKLILLLFCLPAFAGEVTVTWVAPTENTDGTPLTDLAGYWIYYGNSAGIYPNRVEVPDPAALSHTLELPAGTYYFVATAYNDSNVESAFSNEAIKTVTSVPNPPTGLTADVDQVAYAISQSPDRIVLYPVGVLEQTTECDSFQSVNGYNLVPRNSVRFAAGVSARTVFAQCSGG